MNFHPEPMLWATPETARALASLPAAVFLVGSYDGSRNYGDMIQLQAAAKLARDFSGVAPIAVIELEFAESDLSACLAAGNGSAPWHCLYFATYRDGSERDPRTGDELLPALATRSLAAAATFLYGGGYLNRAWGQRKLAMVRAVDALVRPTPARRPQLVASGLQLERGWLESLGPEDRGTLDRLDAVGVRDSESSSAIAAVAKAEPLLTGDDAIDLLPVAPSRHPAPRDELAVNLHVCLEDWVTADGERLLGFIGELLLDLSRIDGRPLRVLPLIAYHDERVSERPALEGLCAQLLAMDHTASVAAPAVLNPASLAGLSAALAGSELTLACSYHVALTSAMLGVPPALIVDNDYYAQKSLGLRAAFGLPGPLFVRPQDPAAAAAAIAGCALGTSGDPLRRSLTAAAQRLANERRSARAEIGGALARGLVRTLTERETVFGEGAARADELNELGVLREDHQRLLRAVAPAQRAQLSISARLAEAEAVIAELIGSTSWRVTAPFRRVARWLGRR